MVASPSMIAAVDAVWRIQRPDPDNLMASPQFDTLSELCQAECERAVLLRAPPAASLFVRFGCGGAQPA